MNSRTAYPAAIRQTPEDTLVTTPALFPRLDAYARANAEGIAVFVPEVTRDEAVARKLVVAIAVAVACCREDGLGVVRHWGCESPERVEHNRRGVDDLSYHDDEPARLIRTLLGNKTDPSLGRNYPRVLLPR